MTNKLTDECNKEYIEALTGNAKKRKVKVKAWAVVSQGKRILVDVDLDESMLNQIYPNSIEKGYYKIIPCEVIYDK